jgi:hypothetical protein
VESREADEFLAERWAGGDLTQDAPQAILLLGELRRLTRWDDVTLCERLGCKPERWAEMGAAEDEDDHDAVKHSLEFLKLVLEVTALVERTEDCRRMLNKAFELCAEAGGPASKPVPRIRRALDSRAEDGFTARDLLGIGEIGAGWRLAELHLDRGVAHERAAAADRLTGPVVARTPHLSRERVELLVGPHPGHSLGNDVSARMRTHIQRCKKCRRLAEHVAPGFDFSEPEQTAAA